MFSRCFLGLCSQVIEIQNANFVENVQFLKELIFPSDFLRIFLIFNVWFSYFSACFAELAGILEKDEISTLLKPFKKKDWESFKQ